MSRAERITKEAQLQSDEKEAIRVDVAQLRLGTYVRYHDRNGIEHYGLISDLTEKRCTIQLWATIGGGPMLVTDDTVALSKVKEILGQKELPKPVEKPKIVRLAPNRPEGYKDCDRSKCNKPIYGIIGTQAMLQTYTGFKFGDIEPGQGTVLVALCSGHWKQRDSYGIIGETWLDYPKPPTKPVDMVEPQEQAETPAKHPKGSDAYSEPRRPKPETVRKDGKVDGRSLRWKIMTDEQRKAQARKMTAGRWKK